MYIMQAIHSSLSKAFWYREKTFNLLYERGIACSVQWQKERIDYSFNQLLVRSRLNKKGETNLNKEEEWKNEGFWKNS